MRNDTAVFILSHERANTPWTLNTLKKQNYSGDIYIVIDNEDSQRDEYYSLGVPVIEFDKRKIQEEIDTCDNFYEKLSAGVFAREAITRKAKELGYKYHIQLDDDYTGFNVRKVEKGKLATINIPFEKMVEMCVEYMDECEKIDCISFCNQGDYIGGVKSKPITDGVLRKAVNVYIMKADTNIHFVGRLYDDATTSIINQLRGMLYITIGRFEFTAKPLYGNTKGGMSEMYKNNDKLVRGLYPLMVIPGAVRLSMTNKGGFVSKKSAYIPMILSERYKKNDA